MNAETVALLGHLQDAEGAFGDLDVGLSQAAALRRGPACPRVGGQPHLPRLVDPDRRRGSRNAALRPAVRSPATGHHRRDGRMLTCAQTASFHRDGFLAVRGFLDQDTARGIARSVRTYFGEPANGDESRRALSARSIEYRPPGEPAPVSRNALARLFECLAPNPNWAGS